MKRISIGILCVLSLFWLSPNELYAQEPTPFADDNVDDLEDVSDDFQEQFFEALKQKGIENHDRAIQALNACIAMEPERDVLYFERAKNYIALKEYERAEADLLEALRLAPHRESVMVLLYDLYYELQDYEKAEGVVLKLVPFDVQYKEDLARIYSRARRYDEALDLLDELDRIKGQDAYREQLRNRIFAQAGYTQRQTQQAEAQLAADPQNEAEYLKLIFLYSEQGETQKAYDTALKLQAINPEADEVQLALYKFYLEDQKIESAVDAMHKVLRSQRLDEKVKHRVINDFLLYVNDNPQLESELEEAIAIFDAEVKEARVYEELGNYFIKKKDKARALPYFEKALVAAPDDLGLIQNVVLLLLDTGAYEKALEQAQQGLEYYPAQPLLYLTSGVAQNQLKQPDEAIVSLEAGLDYIIDDLNMEADFYEQLSNAYQLKGNPDKAAQFAQKAAAIKTEGN